MNDIMLTAATVFVTIGALWLLRGNRSAFAAENRMRLRTPLILIAGVLALARGWALWYFYVPIAMKICPTDSSTILYVFTRPTLTEQQLGNYVRTDGAAVIGLAPKGWNTYPVGGSDTTVVWLVEVPCVTDSAESAGQDAWAIRNITSSLLSHSDVIKVIDLNAVPSNSSIQTL